MNKIEFNDPLFIMTEKVEKQIYFENLKLPNQVFRYKFEKFCFMFSDQIFRTSKSQINFIQCLIKNSKSKAILTSLIPRSDGKERLKYLIDSDVDESNFIEAMNFDPVDKLKTKNLIFGSNILGLYSLNNLWAIYGDPWDMDIAVLGLNNSLYSVLNLENTYILQNIETLFSYVSNESNKRKLILELKNNYEIKNI